MYRESICSIVEGNTNVIATAVHAGNSMRRSLEKRARLTATQRLREEDPYTDIFARGVNSRIVATKSRFQVDLNRPRDQAVYRTPEDAWGLDIWLEPLSQKEISRSQQEYDAFYTVLKEMLDRGLQTHDKMIVLDLHSYNHRRMGERAPFDDPVQNPEINIGTGTMVSRERWQKVIDSVSDGLRNAVIMGRFLDVRENVKFQGGEMARWIHTHYPETVCCLSLEFKKFFMNEWNGEGDMVVIHEIKEVIREIADYLETI